MQDRRQWWGRVSRTQKTSPDVGIVEFQICLLEHFCHSVGMAFSSSSSENNFGESSSRLPPSSRSSRGRTSQGTSRERSSHATGLPFDILAWYPKHQSCLKFFLDHAQHDVHVQAFAAFINILLPYQRQQDPIFSSTGGPISRDPDRAVRDSLSPRPGQIPQVSVTVSLVPYIRRLVVTGMDVPQVLHGFFGNDWEEGIGSQREVERRNYLFAAKSEPWSSVKSSYDMLPSELVPFLRPLAHPTDPELESADKTWSEWLAMGDWMIGSRAPT